MLPTQGKRKVKRKASSTRGTSSGTDGGSRNQAPAVDPETLGTVLGLSARTQRGEDLWSSIHQKGLSCALRADCQRLVLLDVLGVICESIANGTVREDKYGSSWLPDLPKDVENLLDMLPDFITEDEREFLKDKTTIDNLHQDASRWLPLFADSLEGADFFLVNRQPLVKGLSRMIARAKAVNGPNLSNKTVTCPGPNRKPHISSTGTTVAFSNSVCREFVSGQSQYGVCRLPRHEHRS